MPEDLGDDLRSLRTQAVAGQVEAGEGGAALQRLAEGLQRGAEAPAGEVQAGLRAAGLWRPGRGPANLITMSMMIIMIIIIIIINIIITMCSVYIIKHNYYC